MIRDSIIVIASVLVIVCVTIGPPRLIGTGCEGFPSVRLAREESDFLVRCANIRPLPWSITE